MTGRKNVSLTTRLVVTVGLILLAANIVLGLVTLDQTKGVMRTLINKNMLDITDSAAGFIDGDAMAALTAEDVGGEAWTRIADALTVFQKNSDVRFIYAVRQAGEGSYIFVVDPDPEEPADFGEEIVLTPGLVAAGNGVPTVDDAPMADRWGNFYSAFSPVFDSNGHVAGIVGIDFDAEWYDDQVRRHTLSIGVISLASVVFAGVAVFLITSSVRRRFKELDAGLSMLSANVDRLMDEAVTISGYAPRAAPTVSAELSGDELAVLGRKIHDMQDDMVAYLDYLRRQAHYDALTHVRNSTAYHEDVDRLEAMIAGGGASFYVVVYDLNSLKEINDNDGHQSGDFIIKAAADILAGVFGTERTYRIGGDEFAVICEGATEAEMAEKLEAVDAAVRGFNAVENPHHVRLAVSRGLAQYEPGTDASYKQVFARADGMMYVDKRQYYETVGNRRRGR